MSLTVADIFDLRAEVQGILEQLDTFRAGDPLAEDVARVLRKLWDLVNEVQVELVPPAEHLDLKDLILGKGES